MFAHRTAGLRQGGGKARSAGVPFGVYPRLVLAWMATEAVRTKSCELILGGSLAAFGEARAQWPTGFVFRTDSEALELILVQKSRLVYEANSLSTPDCVVKELERSSNTAAIHSRKSIPGKYLGLEGKSLPYIFSSIWILLANPSGGR